MKKIFFIFLFLGLIFLAGCLEPLQEADKGIKEFEDKYWNLDLFLGNDKNDTYVFENNLDNVDEYNEWNGWNDIEGISVESIADSGEFKGNIILYVKFQKNFNAQWEDFPKDAAIYSKVWIYTSKYAEDGKTRIPDRLLYSGNHTITNIAAINNLTPNKDHLLIPRDELGEIYDDDLPYGIAVVEIKLPNGKIVQDYAYLVKLK